ncbi:hypothetical protein FQN57_001541 [Myotisia sp. PD_48]|nr:hypothetical protein FQN57_001541 [Myotisia sp. PD_48]
MLSSKTSKLTHGGHTAGIFADMSVDGPEIGTLVVIMDRAKNLPNRKTMGKQNPYCAARLGKEAKKTDTDMRGGQTPKWDQELRFTVHESPDYLQLKVSVFNDDKKTDLIGETWVDLKSVIVPGGGQNDLWHNLQCKGKYAGELRIELTYYDTRPKDVSVIERRREAAGEAKKAVDDTRSDHHKSKPPKRRPLPADPTSSSSPAAPIATNTTAAAAPASTHQVAHPRPATEHRKRGSTHPAPARTQPVPSRPQNTPAPKPQRHYDNPDDFQQHWETPPTAPQSATDHYPPQHPSNQQHQAGYDAPYNHDRGLNHSQSQPQPQPAQMPVQNDQVYPPPQAQHHYEPSYSEIEPHDYQADNHYQHQELASSFSNTQYEIPPRQPAHHSVMPDRRQNGQHSYVQPARSHDYSPLDGYTHQPPPEPQKQRLGPSPSPHNPHHHYSVSRNDVSHENQLPVSHTPVEEHYHDYNRMNMSHPADDTPDDDLPPPPPIHREGLGKQPSQQFQKSSDNQLVHHSEPIPMPEPLNLGGNSRNSHRSNTGEDRKYIAYSPNYSNQTYDIPPSPHGEVVYSTSPAPSYHSFGRQEAMSSVERPSTSGSERIPPSLMAGYGQGGFEDETSLTHTDHRIGRRRSNIQTQPELFEETSQHMADDHFNRRQNHVPAHAGFAIAQHTRSSPAPMPERKSVSPDPRRVPARKSVSPHPQSLTPDPDSLSGIPFSPDSYDALNPAAGNASAVRHPASPYDTPEEALEAARQYEVEKLRELGPILGNDGRVIDPSDHLPADTWAPEPERKSKKPEVVVRFKHTSHTNRVGPRPSPQDRDRGRHRESISTTPITHHSPSSGPPVHARLQKKSSRPQSSYSSSSNHIDHHGSSSSTPSRTRNQVHEREDYSQPYHNTSMNTPPSYRHEHRMSTSPSPSPSARPSPSNFYQKTGPPIPAKVPVFHPDSQNHPPSHQENGSSTGQGYYGGSSGMSEVDALSRELKSIDIGSGRGSSTVEGRRPRSSYIGSYGQ